MTQFIRLVFACAVITAIATPAFANLLQNSSFEEEGTQIETAKFWKMNDPDDHGDAWGNAIRVDWRAHEGTHIGVVRGSWAGMGEYGGFWQEAEITAGTTYRATAWFWADGKWIAEVQELKIEFWSSDRSEKLDEKIITLHDVSELWVQKEVEGVAPEGAGWARVVINVSDVGGDGALQFDEVSLIAAP